MKRLIYFLCSLVILFSLNAEAQKKKVRGKTKRTQKIQKNAPNSEPTNSQVNETKSKLGIIPQKVKNNTYRLTVNGILWQESIEANRNGTKANLDSEFKGVGVGASIRIPFKESRWMQSYGAEFYLGNLMSKGNPVIQDEFEQQPWYLIMINPGVVYQTTRFSEIGLSLPLSLRSIKWELDDATLFLDKNNSISYGLSFAYTSYLTPNNAITFAVISQIAWSATQWTLGWNYKL